MTLGLLGALGGRRLPHLLQHRSLLYGSRPGELKGARSLSPRCCRGNTDPEGPASADEGSLAEELIAPHGRGPYGSFDERRRTYQISLPNER